MELCLRIAVCVFAVIGLLQSQPVPCPSEGDFDFEMEATYEGNQTFVIQTTLKPECFSEVLSDVIKGMEHAKSMRVENISENLSALKQLERCSSLSQGKCNSTKKQVSFGDLYATAASLVHAMASDEKI